MGTNRNNGLDARSNAFRTDKIGRIGKYAGLSLVITRLNRGIQVRQAMTPIRGPLASQQPDEYHERLKLQCSLSKTVCAAMTRPGEATKEPQRNSNVREHWVVSAARFLREAGDHGFCRFPASASELGQ